MRLQLLLSILSLSTITAAGAGVGAWVGTKVFNFEKEIKEKKGDVNGVEKAEKAETKENLQFKSQEENNSNLETQITNLSTKDIEVTLENNQIPEETDISIQAEPLNPQQLLQELPINVIQIHSNQGNKTTYSIIQKQEQQQNSVILKLEESTPYKTSGQMFSNNVMDPKLLDEEEEKQKKDCETRLKGTWNEGSSSTSWSPGSKCIVYTGEDGIITL